jgi:PKD repeat protein
VTVPAILAISLASVLAGSLILAVPFTGSLFHPAEHAGIDNGLRAEATTLPVNIIDRFTSKQLAGDAERGSRFMKIEEEFIDPEQHCEFCTRVEYTPGRQGLAGFAYESPRGVDLSGAKRMLFWAMGEEGGEKITFKVAGKPLDGLQDTADRPQDRADRPQDRVGNVTSRLDSIFGSERFALTTQQISLEDDWKKYEVDVTGTDLRGITLPFGFELSKGAGSQKQVFYMKGLTYDTEPAEDPLATIAEALVVTPLSTEISGNATSGEAPMTVELESNTTGGIEPYVDPRWEFGDDEEGEGENVSHTYSEPGEYNVTFTVDDSGNQTASDSLIVVVTEPEAEPEQQQEEVPTDGENATGNDEDGGSSSDDSSSSSSDDCDDSYPDVCISPPPPVLDCSDIDEEDFEVRGSDPHGFDDDNDGVGCEAEDSSSSSSSSDSSDSSSSSSSDDSSSSTTVSDTDNGVQQVQQSETSQEGNSTQEE